MGEENRKSWVKKAIDSFWSAHRMIFSQLLQDAHACSHPFDKQCAKFALHNPRPTYNIDR
jgi:hypothetical protein